jgi:FkbM family methyltransferase
MDIPALEKLAAALAFLGRDPTQRSRIVALCLAIERDASYTPGQSIREDITGPIVDALYDKDTIVERTLRDGTRFRLYYRTKIARDFVMASHPHPDHVWEPQTTKLLLHLADKARHAVIGGAYFGDQVVLMAKRMAPHGGTCHAFEPNGDQLKMLRENAALNELRNILSWRLGLWRDSGSRLVLVGDDSFAHAERVEHEAPNAFATISIDEYLAGQGILSLDLIMLDIEGGEMPALEGARKQLAKRADEAPNVVFEVHRSYVDWSKGLENTEIVRYMSDFGYTVFAIRDFNSNVDMGSSPIELVPPDRVYLEGPPHGFNMLAVKDLKIVENGPFVICRDVSPKLLWHKDPNLHHPLSLPA